MRLLPARRRAYEELLLPPAPCGPKQRRPWRQRRQGGRPEYVAHVRPGVHPDAHLEVALQRAQRRQAQPQEPVLAREVANRSHPDHWGVWAHGKVVVLVAHIRVDDGRRGPGAEGAGASHLIREDVEDEVNAAHEIELHDHDPGRALGLPLVLAVC